MTRYISPSRDSISHDQTQILHITQSVDVEDCRLESEVRPTNSSTDPADRQGILPGQLVE